MAQTTNGFADARPSQGRSRAEKQAFDLLQTGLYSRHIVDDGEASKCSFCGCSLPNCGFGSACMHLVYECDTFSGARRNFSRAGSIRQAFVGESILSLLLKGIVLLNNGASPAEVRAFLIDLAFEAEGDGSGSLQDCKSDAHFANFSSDGELISRLH